MKRVILIALVFLGVSLNGFSQLLEFRPFIGNDNSSSQSTQQEDRESYRTTGYVLNGSGTVEKKVQIRVSIENSIYGETITVVAYYDSSVYGGAWKKISSRAYPTNKIVPIANDDKVGCPNFTYKSHWGAYSMYFD